MGRVLIYTDTGDAASQRVKEVFDKRRVAYVEVNIAECPGRKKELKQLCGKKSVPQIFFNEAHIGGATELLALEKTKRLDEMLEKVFKEPTPETPTAPTEAEKGTPKKKKKSSAGGEGKLKKKKKREGSGGVASALAPAQGAPTLQKKKSVAGSLSGDSLNESTDESSSLTLAADDEDDALAQDEDGLEIEVKERIKEPLTAYELEEMDYLFEQLRDKETGLKRRDIGAFNRTKECFKAFEVIMWLMTRMSVEEEMAIQIGQKLVDSNYIHRTKDNKASLQDDYFTNSTDVYKFYMDDDAKVLNMRRLITEQPPVEEIQKKLEEALFAMISKHYSTSLQCLDYVGLGKSSEFKNYVTQSLNLQTLCLKKLSQTQLKALFINVYNGLSIHAIVSVGAPTTGVDRQTFFDELSYVIDGQKYSLYDIKHGVLRANRRPPGLLVRRFSKTDPRISSVVTEFDPRVHFALVCGTRSCPTLRVFSAVDLDWQLTDATKHYCTSSTKVIADLKQLIIARTFGWFHDDFGAADPELLAWMLPYVQGDLHKELQTYISNPAFEVRCSQWNFELNSWDKDNLTERTVNTGEEARDKDVLLLPAPGFRCELGTCNKLGYFGILTDSSQNFDLNVYKAFFHDVEHTNYLGEDSEEGPVCLSVARITTKGSKQRVHKKYRVLVRTEKADSHAILAAPSQREMFEALKSVFPFVDKKILHQIDDSKFSEDLLSFEDQMMYTEFKFGVLYSKEGQTLEDDMFGNVETSPEYEDFLNLLGEKVKLQGWDKYAAGLDVEKNQTGVHSIYTSWNNYEIMFHVSTLLPFSKTDTQQIERKRHLGNDAVLIIFQDGNTPFSPECITSRYNQIYVVVQVVRDQRGTSMYKVAVASRDGVPEYGPRLPDPPLFSMDHVFRDFLLKKVINGLHSSMRSPGFAKKITRSRSFVLANFVEKYGVGEHQ